MLDCKCKAHIWGAMLWVGWLDFASGGPTMILFSVIVTKPPSTISSRNHCVVPTGGYLAFRRMSFCQISIRQMSFCRTAFQRKSNCQMSFRQMWICLLVVIAPNVTPLNVNLLNVNSPHGSTNSLSFLAAPFGEMTFREFFGSSPAMGMCPLVLKMSSHCIDIRWNGVAWNDIRQIITTPHWQRLSSLPAVVNWASYPQGKVNERRRTSGRLVVLQGKHSGAEKVLPINMW